MGFKDLSNCAKGGIACGVCSAVVAAIMIPVGLLVIAPNMGQHALNVAVMNIPNSTVYNIPSPLYHHATVAMFNSVKLTQSALPFHAKLHETDMVVNLPGSPTDPNDPASWMNYPRQNLGWFTMPEQGVSHGENDFSFDVSMDVLAPNMMVKWTMSLGMGGFPNGTDIYIVGEPKLTALGLVSMKLKLGKKLHCTYVPQPTPPPAPTTPTTTTVAPASTTAAGNTTTNAFEEMAITERRLQFSGDICTLTCVDMGEMDDDVIDEVLANFTRDRDTPRTTTTTEAPAMV